MRKHIDATGLAPPEPVLRARRALENLQVADILTITTSDPDSLSDIPAFCKIAGHSLVMAEEREGLFFFVIEKGTSQPIRQVESPLRR